MSSTEDIAADLEEPETAPVVTPSSKSKTLAAEGTILEAAFVDPAYPWPPIDGQGRNAIELQATIQLMQTPADDDVSYATTDSLRRRMVMPAKPVPPPPVKQRWWQCCKSMDEVVVDTKEYEEQRMKALEAQQEYAQLKSKRTENKPSSAAPEPGEDVVEEQRYARVPEGILIYRLDTSTHQLKLMSSPHADTNLVTLITDMIVTQATASSDPSRRGMDLTGEDGRIYPRCL
jgi:hypothetical protein